MKSNLHPIFYWVLRIWVDYLKHRENKWWKILASNWKNISSWWKILASNWKNISSWWKILASEWKNFIAYPIEYSFTYRSIVFSIEYRRSAASLWENKKLSRQIYLWVRPHRILSFFFSFSKIRSGAKSTSIFLSSIIAFIR